MAVSQGIRGLAHVSHPQKEPMRAMRQDVKYGEGGVLGLARTWPQAACALPSPGTAFDWEGDRPLNLPLEDLVIYEMHVRGFTWDVASSVSSRGAAAGSLETAQVLRWTFDRYAVTVSVRRRVYLVLSQHTWHTAVQSQTRMRVQARGGFPKIPKRHSLNVQTFSVVFPCLAGTFAGLTERLDYLTTLGINAIELQPVHEFNELEYYQVNPSVHTCSSLESPSCLRDVVQ